MSPPRQRRDEPTPEEWGAIMREGLVMWAIIALFATIAIVGWWLTGALSPKRTSETRIGAKRGTP